MASAAGVTCQLAVNSADIPLPAIEQIAGSYIAAGKGIIDDGIGKISAPHSNP